MCAIELVDLVGDLTVERLSFLRAFLTEAAISGTVDDLRGLKENVIMGA